MAGIVYYYLTTCVAFLAIAIYNLNSSTSSSNLQCYSIQPMDYITFNNYVNSLGNNTQTTLANLTIVQIYLTGNSSLLTNDPNQIYEVPVPKVNVFLGIQRGIGIIYIALLIINFFLLMSVKCMENITPEDFLHLGKFRKVMGMCCKVVPMLTVILHWIVFIVIIVDWGFIASRYCAMSVSNVPGTVVAPDKYFGDNLTLNIVTTAMWILLHYVGSLIRDIFYQEPFMYTPTGQTCCKAFLSKLGP